MTEHPHIVPVPNLHFLGQVPLNVDRDYQRFVQWLEDGKHGEMHYLKNHLQARQDPSFVFKNAQSAFVFSRSYACHLDKDQPQVARYALPAMDYHKSLEKEIAQAMTKHPGTYKICVDRFPILERALAAKTRQGYIGKNTLFIDQKLGSFVVLGVVLTDQECSIEPQTPIDQCGSCRRCQVHCPTGALNEDYVLDARRCLSYWSIEHRGPIPRPFWPYFAKYWYGCDICQDVCPKNRDKPVASPTPSGKWSQLTLWQVAKMDQKTYEAFFGGTALTRAKKNGLRRNALLGLWATERNTPRFNELLEEMLCDPDPMLQAQCQMINEQS